MTRFDEWWEREGKFYDPDTEDVPWFDKRKSLAEKAFAVATAQSGNYIADDSVNATKVTFSNGRIVAVQPDGFLSVGMEHDNPPTTGEGDGHAE